MNDESRLDELLDEWEAARQQGREPALETLCQDCPELLRELKQRVTRLKHVDRLLYPRSVEKTVPDAPATAARDTGLDDGERRLGRYRLDAPLGKGGFGEVWRAYDPELRRAVAIKVLRPERSHHHGQVERFQEEARKLAQLRHPNIVPVFDVGQSDGAAFIVSELVEGENLAAVLKGRRFGWAEAACDSLTRHPRAACTRTTRPKRPSAVPAVLSWSFPPALPWATSADLTRAPAPGFLSEKVSELSSRQRGNGGSGHWRGT